MMLTIFVSGALLGSLAGGFAGWKIREGRNW